MGSNPTAITIYKDLDYMFLSILKNPEIPLRIRKKIKKFMDTPEAGQAFTAPLFEYLYHGQTGNHQDDKIFTYGMHEPATIRFMRAVLRFQKDRNIDPVYADIGTNMGQHLLAICGLAQRAFGFEPWGVVRTIAQKQLDENQVTNTQILPFGLSDQDASLSYTRPANNNLGTGMFVKEGGTDILDVRQGDPVFEGMSVMPSLLKIDTEGFEDRVLRGLKQTIANARPVIVFEYSTQTRQIMTDEGAFRFLLALGYKLYGIKPSREFPCFAPFNVHKKFENAIAWPYDEDIGEVRKYLD